MHKRQLSTWQVTLISVGGMIGGAWLFAPYFIFKSVGIVGALFAWTIIAFIATMIAISFAEVISMLPISGAMTRFLKVTHGNTVTFLMLVCGWVSYIVIVPLDAQATVRYLSFWFPVLSQHAHGGVELTLMGTLLAIGIIIALTWLNTQIITKVANTNSIATLWKIFIPLSIALFVILKYGHFHVMMSNIHSHPLDIPKVFASISTDGVAFALLGFQSGLLLSKLCKDKKKGMVYSLFAPLIFATAIMMSLSVMFSLVSTPVHSGNIAPLLGLLFAIGIQFLVVVLFVDAMIAPLGSGNVYITFSGRVLYSFAREFLPNSKLAKLNKEHQPATCLWINALISCIFLLPFPTWKALANFFSSIIALMYLAGPVALIVLREKAPELTRTFYVKWHVLVGYVGFIGCSLLIFWSGTKNIEYLTILLLVLYLMFVIFKYKTHSRHDLLSGSLVVIYCSILWILSEMAKHHILTFPYDIISVALINIVLCYLFTISSLSAVTVVKNINNLIAEEQTAV